MRYTTEANKQRTQKLQSKGKRVKNKIGIIVFRVFVAAFIILGFAAAGIGLGVYFGIVENAPKLTNIQSVAENFTTIIYSEATGLEVDRLDGGESREFVKIEKIPKYLQYAFISIEDERFFEHDGVDYKGFVRATYQTLFENSKQGGSTITQQVIKNKLGIKRNTIPTKIQEQYLATEFEKTLTQQLGSKEKAKAYILEIYLNGIALGKGQIGVQAAALRYFNKNVEDLTLAECCVIAAITQNPTGYNPIDYPEKNIKRRNTALDNMLEFGFITQKEYDNAMKEDVYSKISAVETAKLEQPSFHTYYNDMIITLVINDLMSQYAMTKQEATNLLYNGGLRIYSAEDEEMQRIVDEAFLNEELFTKHEYEVSVTYIADIYNSLTDVTSTREKKGTVKTMDDVDAWVAAEREKMMGQNGSVVNEVVYKMPQPQSAMVIMDYHTGAVKAIAGGRGVKQTGRSLNRATASTRQPGSVFKVLASYAPALDMGLITPATMIDDVPYIYGEYEPKNWYDHQAFPYRGLSLVRDGIRDSMNVITVKNLSDLGINNAMNYLKNFKFTTLVADDYGLPTALGGITNGITQLEATAAFGAIANGGVYNKPYFYTKVYNHNGEVILENNPQPERVLKATTAFLLTDMMVDAVRSGTGGKAVFREVKMPVSGKTGTTSDNKDLTFAGYTPYYVAGIWLGYDMPKPMSEKTGTDAYHLVLWRTIMEEIHKDLPNKPFEKPEGIVTAEICKESGMLAARGLCDSDPRGNLTRTEYFVSGTVPTDSCTIHRSYQIDKNSGLLAVPSCPAEDREQRVGIVRPVPYTGERPVADGQYEVPAEILAGVTCPIHSPGSSGLTTPVASDPAASGGPTMPEGNQTTTSPESTPSDTPFMPEQTPTETPIPVVTPIPQESQ